MSHKSVTSWSELAFDSWMLASEAAVVIWMRSLRLMMGGPRAQREAERMVAEKLVANLDLIPAILRDGPPSSPEEIGARAVAHYRKPVTANRRRLARGGR